MVSRVPKAFLTMQMAGLWDQRKGGGGMGLSWCSGWGKREKLAKVMSKFVSKSSKDLRKP